MHKIDNALIMNQFPHKREVDIYVIFFALGILFFATF